VESTLREGGRQPGLRLIETMLWDGAGFPRLSLHMARLTQGAGALGWAVPVADVRAALAGLAQVPLRVRLTLDAAGGVAVETATVPPAKQAWRLGLADRRLASGDPWLRIKSTNRGAYDAARRALPEELDELIFLNERGETCDGTITTVFFDRGQGLRTPPLSSGLLPGVLRADLACPEEVLMAEDLPRVRLWVGNALRGLIPADFILT
jgi:4-amino-4-deoxychorismate lyase